MSKTPFPAYQEKIMLIRDPLVHATYFYLREAPGDNLGRRQDRHEAFVADVYRMLQSVSGWLSMPEPALPRMSFWEAEAPVDARLVMETGELQGRINASAWLHAYVLRNMLLLHVSVSRIGEHEQSVWSILDEALGDAPTTPSWLHTTRYWCGTASRPPENLEQERSLPIKTSFGVLCLGRGTTSHLLVYSDARTQGRANVYLRGLAAELDWYRVQAQYRLEQYDSRASGSERMQQQALDRIAQSLHHWSTPGGKNRLRSLAPLHTELEVLESTYNTTLADRVSTEAMAQEMQSLVTGYQLTLMRSGLWDAAPTVWESQVAELKMLQGRVEADLYHIETTLHRIDILIQSMQTRIMMLQGERERLLVYMLALLGMAVLTVLVADTDITRMVVRLLALIVVAGVVWFTWQRWLRARLP